jgi:hypothetical protein
MRALAFLFIQPLNWLFALLIVVGLFAAGFNNLFGYSCAKMYHSYLYNQFGDKAFSYNEMRRCRGSRADKEQVRNFLEMMDAARAIDEQRRQQAIRHLEANGIFVDRSNGVDYHEALKAEIIRLNVAATNAEWSVLRAQNEGENN